jgi:hypothetical protein
MCYLVTVGTREPLEKVKTLLQIDRRSPVVTVLPASNPSLRSIFPPRDRLFHAIVGQCSCDVLHARKDKQPQETFVRWLRELAPVPGGVRAFTHWHAGA